jgi:hypothetical protein
VTADGDITEVVVICAGVALVIVVVVERAKQIWK